MNELRQNARYFWSKPAAKVVLAVLALAISPRGDPRPRLHDGGGRRRRASARCYALGFVDALKKREYGSSIGANDAEHDDLVEATLEDLPPEAQGIRDQWEARWSESGRRAAADCGSCAMLYAKQASTHAAASARRSASSSQSTAGSRGAVAVARRRIAASAFAHAQSEPPSAPRRARGANLARTPTRRGP